MTETTTSSSILDANIEDILGEVDENITYENIDADAILGEVDEFLAENAIKPEDKTQKSTVSEETPEEEQLDYEEDTAGEVSKQKSVQQSSSEKELRRERLGKKGYNNFEDGNYGVNLNFRGSYPGDLMGMHRTPPYMSFPLGPMHPRFYSGYRGPPPLRYAMMGPGGGPPFLPPMYGPPMGMGPYGGPSMSRGPHGRHPRDQRRQRSDGEKREQERKDKTIEQKETKNEGVEKADVKSNSNGDANKNQQPRFQANRNQSRQQQRQQQQQGQFIGSQRLSARRTPSPVNRLPTVRIGGTNSSGGQTSASSSQSSLVVASSSQAHIPPVSNINAVVSASLRLPLKSASRPPVNPLPQLSQLTQLPPQQILPAIQPLSTPLMMLRPQHSAPVANTTFPIQPPQNVYVNPTHVLPTPTPMMQSTPSVGLSSDWSLMVDAFVKKTAGLDVDRRPRRSFSRSLSRSRSYSRSSSSSRHSSRSYSDASSRSRSPICARSPRSPLPPRHHNRSGRNRSRGVRTERRSNDRAVLNRRPRRFDEDLRADVEVKEDLKRSRECAEAIGLDEEYLRKVEEQKRLREEFTKMRKQKRQQTLNDNDTTGRSDVRRADPRQRGEGRPGRRSDEHKIDHCDRAGVRRGRASPERRNGDRQHESLTSKSTRKTTQRSTPPSSSFTAMPNTSATRSAAKPDERQKGTRRKEDERRRDARTATMSIKAKQEPTDHNSTAAGGKLKAYLAVVVNNVKELDNPYKRVVALTDTVGSTKKVWQTSEDAISIIFAKHEHAKQFMLQYHGKSLAGRRLDVSLEKVFLNLSSMSS